MASTETSLFIRLYTSADVHGKLAGLIRQHGFDAVSAYETGNSRLSRSKFQTSEVSEGDIGSKIASIMPVFTGKGTLERPPRSCYRNILDLLRLDDPEQLASVNVGLF